MNASPPSSREYAALTSSGYLMLIVYLVVVAIAILAIVTQVAAGPAIVVLCLLAVLPIAKGFSMLQPNRAAAIELALDMLSTRKIAEFDVDRRAALVSNLMVALCSERDTLPIVNAGAMT